jgi:two-component system, response regulator YesN
MTILIAEDEPVESVSLRKILFKYYGTSIDKIDIVDDGEAAVRYMEKNGADLIFMDIRMPVKNGLDACNEIRQKNGKVEIVMLTAYSDFEYAQISIRNDVTEYMVKPYSVKSLQSVMDKIFAHLDTEKKEMEIRQNSRKIVRLLEKEFISKITVSSDIEKNTLEDFISLLGLKTCCYRILIFCSSEGLHSTDTIENILQSGLYRYMKKNTDMMFLFFVYDESFEKLLKMKHTDFTPLSPAYMGPVERNWHNLIPNLHRSIRNITPDTGNHPVPYRTIIELEKKLGESVLNRDSSIFRIYCEELASAAHMNYGDSSEFDYYIVQTYRMLVQQLYDLNDHDLDYFMNNAESFFSLPYNGNCDMAVKDLQNAGDRLIEFMTENIKCKNRQMVGYAKKYIDENFTRNISLDSIAVHVSISRYYLSRTFSSLEGISITDYIQSVRIQKAKQLLLDGKTVSEVCYMTGFNDPAYFSKCFRKHTGVPPREFNRK